MVDLPAPLTPTSAVRRPAWIVEVEGRDRRLGPARVRERDVPEGDREAGRRTVRAATGTPPPAPGTPTPRPARPRRAVSPAGARRGWRRPRGDGATRRPRVVARGELAQGQEELGHDDEDRQRAVEGDRTVHQSQADLDRDERDRDGAAPLEHERGLERGPQDLHRRVAVLAADRPDRVDLLAAPAEHLERGEAPQHVEEERAEPADLGEPPRGDRARPATDVRQQQDEDRAGEEQDERGRRVDDEDRGHDQERDGDGERPGGLERRDVGIDRVQPVERDPGQLAGPLATRVGRAEGQQVSGQVAPAGRPARDSRPACASASPASSSGARSRARSATATRSGATVASRPRRGRRRRPTTLTSQAWAMTTTAAPKPQAMPAASRLRAPGPWRSRRASGRRTTRSPAAFTRASEALIAVAVDDGLAPEDVVDAGRVEQHERDADDARRSG